MSKLETLVYYGKYSLGSYADALLSIPLGMGNGIVKATGFLCDIINKESPAWASKEHIKNNSPIYKTRHKLRDSLDTGAGTIYLQSNIMATVAMFGVGIPAAEIAQTSIINHWLKESSEFVKIISNSLITLNVQMVVGYTVFMANEIRANKHKYQNEKGSYSLKKISSGIKRAIKTFFPFDFTYTSLKLTGQSIYLYKGQSPGIASAMADSIACPLFYMIAIPLGLYCGLIEAKRPKEVIP